MFDCSELAGNLPVAQLKTLWDIVTLLCPENACGAQHTVQTACCRQCWFLEGQSPLHKQRTAGAGGPMRGNKQPDWLCRDCGNKNFGWREVCNRCQVGAHALQSFWLQALCFNRQQLGIVAGVVHCCWKGPCKPIAPVYKHVNHCLPSSFP